MKIPTILLSLTFSLAIAISNSQTIEKEVYIYDESQDMVLNVPTTNVAYGHAVWSYEVNNRPNSDERAGRFRSRDIVGCSIMDFGCNEGGVLFACRRLGAGKIIGIDYNAWCISSARKKAKEQGVKGAIFVVGDMENKGLYTNLPTVDTVFLLAILDTSGFANKQAVLSRISRFAKKALYYEGHVTAESHVRRMYELLLFTDFTRFEYLGRFDGRILIRCGRELYGSRNVPRGAVTSDSSDEALRKSKEIYVYTDSKRNPPFGANCRLIQYVDRNK